MTGVLIFLGILIGIAVIITVILMLPVLIIIKTDENGELILRYKFLFKAFGENPNPNNTITKVLKAAAGIDRFEKQNLQTNVRRVGVVNTASQMMRIVVDLLKEVARILKYCTAKRFGIKIVCAEEDAADTAVSYGRCCAAVYPIAGAINSVMKVRRKGQRIDISCDYLSCESNVSLDIVISVKLFRILAAFFRIAFEEARRKIDEQTVPQSKASSQATDDAVGTDHKEP